MPTIRGRNQLEHASGTMPRRANTKPMLRVLGREPDVHRQRHRDADADRGAVDRGDDRLLRLEDAQGEQAPAVARRPPRDRPRRLAPPCANVSPPPRQIGPGAEAPPPPGDDDRPDVVVGVRPIERRRSSRASSARERVQLLGTIEGDRGDLVLDCVGDLLVVGHVAVVLTPRTVGLMRSDVEVAAHRNARADGADEHPDEEGGRGGCR